MPRGVCARTGECSSCPTCSRATIWVDRSARLRRLRRWAAPELLIIDDVGLGQVKRRDDEPTAAHTLFNLIDKRHAKSSTAVTSNIKLGAWGRYLGDATLAAAILDRLAMHAVRLDIVGPATASRSPATAPKSAAPSFPRKTTSSRQLDHDPAARNHRAMLARRAW